MAKAKKQEKPIEQRLEEALVLYEKTPYDLPSNWCWTTFEQIANLYTGNSINEREKELKYTGLSEGYNYIATKDIGFDYEIEYENGIKIPYEETRFKKARKGASLLCIEGGSAGRKLGFLQEEVCFVNKLCCFDFHGLVDKLYFYYLQSNEFFNLFNANKVGLIGGVSVNNLKQIAVPLAPLEEQKRIVEIIDKQFAKLDEARDLIQASLDSFADRKSAILHKAFTGELTKKWRVKNKVSDGWKAVPFKEFCYLNRGFDLPIQNRVKGKVPLVASNGIIDYVDRTNVIGPGVVTGRSGTIGKVFYIKEDYWPLNTSLYSKDCCGNNAKYIYYYLSSFNFKQYSSSTAVPTLNRNNFFNVEVKVPSIEEQEEIVRILDSIFEKEDKSKELLDMLDKIDEMKKSILARAFRGQLGTNNPTDESAATLIKQIIKEKIQAEDIKQKSAPKKRGEVNFVVKTILEALKSTERLTPERLKEETGFEIDVFYDQLKVLIDAGQVREIRIDGESYLEAVQ